MMVDHESCQGSFGDEYREMDAALGTSTMNHDAYETKEMFLCTALQGRHTTFNYLLLINVGTSIRTPLHGAVCNTWYVVLILRNA